MSVLGVILAILAIGLLIIVHEAGHYFVARWCKMRVDRFSIGFGPGVATWKRGDTTFQIAPIPFGGYVEIRGMNIAEDVDPNDPHAYPNRPAWQRFLTIFAGPGTNYLFAIVLAVLLFGTAGVPSGTSWYVVNSVSQQFDAHGKIEPGDRIVSLQRPGDAAPVTVYHRHYGQPPEQSLAEMVHASRGAPMQIIVLRGGSEHTLEIRAQQDPELVDEKTKEKQYRLGITLDSQEERVSVGFLAVIGYAIEFPVEQTKISLINLYHVITGEVEGELTGPIGIADVIQQSIRMGWIYALELLVLLNVLIGLFNLLPVPALDGGRLVFLVYEMATRRRPNPRFEATVHMVGIMVLLLVLVVVSIKDIAKIIERFT
jgi:regulator of sigma E protease